MVGQSMKAIVVSLVAVGTLGVPALSSAQSYRYGDDHRRSVVVRCAPGQRAVMEQRRTYGRSRMVARCVGSRRIADGRYGRAHYGRAAEHDRYRPVVRRSDRYDRRHRRSNGRSALVIAGSAATGAGIGGAIKGKRGALIGAAIGGGTASIYEGARRRR